MVSIEFSKKDFLNLVGRELSNQEIKDLLFNLKSEAEIEDDEVKCELTPDRPDLLSVEGMAKATKLYLGLKPRKVEIHDSKLKIKGESEVRPYFLSATLEKIQLTDELVASLMQIQEKIHGTLGRDRKKVAIGVHDLDKLKPPITYDDYKPEEIKFIPLLSEKEMNLEEVLRIHPKGIDYAHLVKGFKKYPLFVDKEGVMSFPPIINSERTKVTDKTKNLFLDITGTDKKAVEQALNIFLSCISERCGKIGTIKINNKKYPRFEEERMQIDPEHVNKILGLDLDEKKIIKCLEKTGYEAKKRGKQIEVKVPYYRADILHEIDIIEDVAIGYGYDKIEPELPELFTIGSLSEKEKYTRKIREIMIGLGFQEVSTFVLTNKEMNFDKMGIEGKAAELLNPVSSEYTICRTWLLPSLLKVLGSNLHVEYPQKLFEVGDVVLLDGSQETKTRTVRKLAGVISYDNANLTEIKSVVESVLKAIGVKVDIKSLRHSSFIDTRCGEIYVGKEGDGIFGEIHPKVLTNFGLERAVIAFEIEIDFGY